MADYILITVDPDGANAETVFADQADADAAFEAAVLLPATDYAAVRMIDSETTTPLRQHHTETEY